MTLVYLDVETTGLDIRRHEVWEIAYAIDDGPILSSVVEHGFTTPDPFALRVNGYLDRAVGVQPDPLFERALIEQLNGAVLVGANPAFDARFLEARWGRAPWRYRLLDIEAYAMGALGFEYPYGLKDVREALVALGHDIPAPDHTAAADVATVRACHLALRSIYAGGRP